MREFVGVHHRRVPSAQSACGYKTGDTNNPRSIEQIKNNVNDNENAEYIRSFATRSPCLVERDCILEITRAGKSGAQRAQIMLIALTAARRHARSLHRWNRLRRDSVPRLHHQTIFPGIILTS
ncbi:hypothetical protein JJB98_26115 [Bradyrhizobium diazoefficiens]|nr:hypothetical protein [Bradyrhizobium diazoefficiens]QQO23164.1 hypothetical protein JJB98_26115 [Bradyrhizobium diazoefficiens]